VPIRERDRAILLVATGGPIVRVAIRQTACNRRAVRPMALALGLLASAVVGCLPIPINGSIQTGFHGDTSVSGRMTATVEGPIEVKLPAAVDPGPMVAVPVRAGSSVGGRVGLVDVDGLILNQNLTGLYSVGENPVASFREKLEAAACDPSVRAVVVRINSAGGSVTACDILAEELRRFRKVTGKPVVSCLMDLSTSGAYYLAVGGDRVVAHPTTITGSIGALLNHYNLQDAMAQLNVRSEPIKSAPLVDAGSITDALPDEARKLLGEMVDGFRDRFRNRVAQHRRGMTPADWKALDDGRVVAGPKALELHLVDRIGYVHDAIDEAEALAGLSGSEVVIFQRKGYPAHSIYAITPNAPIDGQIVRAKVPAFLYLWQPDPTLLRLGGR
jgi:protease-4